MDIIVETTKRAIDKVCREAGITYLALFGSAARGELKESSDVDLLVEFQETPGLIHFIRTKQEFESIFNRKVDLITKKGISKYLQPYIQKDLRKIYG